MELLLVWILNSLALLIVAYLLPGVHVASFGAALLLAVVLGLLNTLIKPLLLLLSLPVTVFTLGFMLLLLNALVFWFISTLWKGVQVQGVWSVALCSVSYSVVAGLLSRLLP